MQMLGRRGAGGGRPVWLAVGAAAVAVAGATAFALVSTHGQAAAGGTGATGSVVRPLTVVATDPTSGDDAVSPDSSLSVTFSAALSADSPQPTLTPPIAGSWSLTGPATLTFTPDESLPPGQAERLQVPGGRHGLRATDGATLASDVSVPFTVAPMSTERVQQLLAELGYLPLTFTPSNGEPAAVEVALAQPGTFAWKWTTFPATLTSQWVEGQPNAITKGAVMAFESENGLAVDGIAGPKVSAALLRDVASGATDPDTDYDWVDVSQALPETVTVWRNGQAVYQTPANTGVPGAATVPGTFPVDLRYQETTMTGTNPDGTTYDDPDIPWVSYFDGSQALHGFVRASYGFPQSDGCVEMPPANAAVVWPMTPIGTLVTVEPQD